MKLTIFQERRWSKTNPLTGETIEKVYYAGFPEKGQPLEFETSKDCSHEVHKGTMRYEADKAEEVALEAVFDSFKGRTKYREEGSYGA